MMTGDISEAQLGWAVTDSVRTRGGKRLLPKGGLIDREALAQWSEVEQAEIHLLELEPGDLHEDEAGRRVCQAAVGSGIEIDGPHHSRYNLNARHKGLLRVDRELVERVNAVGSMSIFTLFDRQAIVAGKTVAGVKATPIVVPESEVVEIEAILGEAGRPAVDVLPFVPKQVFVIATEDLHERLRPRFAEMVRRKMAWYGAEVIDVIFVGADSEAIAAGFQRGLDEGADVFLAAGGNTLDPLDPLFLSLPEIGGRIIHYGAPADPGSMFWLAEVQRRPIFNLASCSMYSEATVVDLMLPLAMAGITLEADHVASLGYGGLLEDDMRFLFPDYDAE